MLVHVRRMRLAYLGIDKAARVDKRLESRLDRSTHRCCTCSLFSPSLDSIRFASRFARPSISVHVSNGVPACAVCLLRIWANFKRCSCDELPKALRRYATPT